MARVIFGIGVNDATYKTTTTETFEGKRKRTWICPYYNVWRGMIRRCYYEQGRAKTESYLNTVVCEDWLLFSQFKDWMEQQSWEGKQLDKDLLVRGNKVYSPETCVFISKGLNLFLTERQKSRGDYLIGCHFENKIGKFKAVCSNPYKGKQETLGFFTSETEAHEAWLERKLQLAKLLAAEQDNQRVAKALIDRYENYLMESQA